MGLFVVLFVGGGVGVGAGGWEKGVFGFVGEGGVVGVGEGACFHIENK